MQPEQLIERQLESSEAIYIDDVIIMPQSESYFIRTPWGNAVHVRPAAVFIDNGGEVTRHPIIDVTRRAQIVLLGLSLVFVVIAWLATFRNEGDTDGR